MGRACKLSYQGAAYAALAFTVSPLVFARTQLYWLDTDGGILFLMTFIGGCVISDRPGNMSHLFLAIIGLAFLNTWWIGWIWYVAVLGLWLIWENWSPTLLLIPVFVLPLFTHLFYYSPVGNELMVSELRLPSNQELVTFVMVSWLPWLISVYGLHHIKDKRQARFLIVWWSFAYLTSMIGGMRFLMFATIPAAIGFGQGTDLMRVSGIRYQSILYAGSVALLCLFAWTWIPSVRYTPEMVATLKQVSDSVDTDHVIITWWPKGNFVNYVTGRRVVTSSTTQGSERTYNVARALCARERGDTVEMYRLLNKTARGRPWVLLGETEWLGDTESISWRTMGGC